MDNMATRAKWLPPRAIPSGPRVTRFARVTKAPHATVVTPHKNVVELNMSGVCPLDDTLYILPSLTLRDERLGFVKCAKWDSVLHVPINRNGVGHGNLPG